MDIPLGGQYGVFHSQWRQPILTVKHRNIETKEIVLQDIRTNVFCASGMHLPNGSFATFGGNAAVTVGGNIGSVLNDGGFSASYDATYQDYDGTKAIRVLNPCPAGSDFTSADCGWFDDPSILSMQNQRWYSSAEPLATGQIAIIGGFVQGGYVNRNYPNTDPQFEGGAADCTYEFYPNTDGATAQTMQFLIDTSGLNSYPHTFLLPSGKMFLQANVSTSACISTYPCHVTSSDFHPSSDLGSRD